MKLPENSKEDGQKNRPRKTCLLEFKLKVESVPESKSVAIAILDLERTS